MESKPDYEIDSRGQTRGTIHKLFAVASSRARGGGSGSLAAGGGDVSPGMMDGEKGVAIIHTPERAAKAMGNLWKMQFIMR